MTNSYSPQQMVQHNCQVDRDYEFREPTPRRGELRGEPEGFQPTETKDVAEAWNDFWSIQGDFICRHHIEPRVQLCVPKNETFPIPLKYFDVPRATFTNLDVLQESGIDDYWNVDVDRSLSDSWTGVTLLRDKPPKGYVWSVERLTKIQATTRPDYLWSEIWSKKGKSRSEESKARMGRRESRARKCSKNESIYFTDPEDGEYKEWIKNTRKKSEVPMEAAMLCKKKRTRKHMVLWEIVARTDEFNKILKTKHAWPRRWEEVPKTWAQRAAADPRGSRTCVCAITFFVGWHAEARQVPPVRRTEELCGWTAKTANVGITIRQIPCSRIILGVEDPIQNTVFKWFRFSVGSYVMDQRSGDGWFFGRIEVFDPKPQKSAARYLEFAGYNGKRFSKSTSVFFVTLSRRIQS